LANLAKLIYTDPMSTMNISLPENLKQFVDQHVAAAGYGSVSDYVRDLIRQDQVRQVERHLAGLIRRGLESGPPRPVHSRYWAAKRIALRSPARMSRRKK
jgi:antitoxin ParD1/3/4